MSSSDPSAKQPQNQYTPVQRIAVGGMAEVMLARQRGMAGFERLVVLKRPLDALAARPGFIQSFLDEARLLAHLSHPNVAQVYDLGQASDGGYFIAMEYVRGVSLGAFVDRARERKIEIPFGLSAWIVAEICAALDFVYRCPDADGRPLKVVHRDLSPQNVMLSFEGRIKLLDFGIAKATTQSRRTAGGVVKGKVAYMAPEQLRGEAADQRSDVFSAGLLLYEVSTGSPPFANEHPYGQMKRLLEGALPDPAAARAGYPAGLAQIYRQATLLDSRRRYSNAGQMRAQLEAYLHATSSRTSPSVRLAELMTRLYDASSPERHRGQGVPIDDAQPLALTRIAIRPAQSRDFTAAGTSPSMPVPRGVRVWIAAVGALLLAAVAALVLWVVGRGDPERAPQPERKTGAPRVGAGDSYRSHRSGASDAAQPQAGATAARAQDAGASQKAARPGSAGDRKQRSASRRRQRLLSQRAARETARRSKRRPKAGEAAPAHGYVTVASQPWGYVFIDGKPYGETPVARVALPAGTHRVEVRAPNGTARRKRSITVASGRLHVVRITLPP